MTSDTPLTRFLAGQTLTQLREIKAEYRNEIDNLRSRMAGLEAEMPLIEQALAEKTGSRKRVAGPASSNGNGSHASSLRQVMLALMSERPGPWTRQELYDALRLRGVAPGGKNPKNTIGNRLLDMEARKEVKRAEGRGTFEIASKGSGRNQLFTGSATREAASDSG